MFNRVGEINNEGEQVNSCRSKILRRRKEQNSEHHWRVWTYTGLEIPLNTARGGKAVCGCKYEAADPVVEVRVLLSSM